LPSIGKSLYFYATKGKMYKRQNVQNAAFKIQMTDLADKEILKYYGSFPRNKKVSVLLLQFIQQINRILKY
jgi:hypothetical protein